jgi:hypothetical protein
MPKLPDIEYAVVTQGPPNPMQAFGAVAQGIEALDAVTSRAAASYADELAKTQVSEASLLVEQGLADTEQKLQKPYLTPEEVKSAFPNGVPPEIATILGRYEGAGDAAVPTHEVGSAIHAEVGKQLTAQATPRVYNPARRAEFERRLAAETLHRNVRVSQAMMAQGAEVNAARSLAVWEQTLNALPAATDAASSAAWAKLRNDISSSGLIPPAKKLELVAKVDEAKAARPVYDAIQSNNPEALRSALVAIESPEASAAIPVAHRASYKRMLIGALDGIERDQEQAEAKRVKLAADAATNGVLALRQRALAGERVTPAQWYAALPPVGSVPPQTLEHLQGMVADAMKPKESQVKTDLGTWALVQNSRVTYPDEWSRGVVVLPDGKKTTILGLHASGGLSLGDSQRLLAEQAEAFAKPDTARPDALQKSDQNEIDRLLEGSYKYNLQKKAGEYIDSKSGNIAGWMYKVVESELATAAKKKPGGRLEVDERNAIIRKTLAREIRQEPGRIYGTNQVVPGVALPPEFDAAYHSLPLMPGRTVSHADMVKTYENFTKRYEFGADEVWKSATGGQPLRARDAAYISVLVETQKADIDAELKRAGKFVEGNDAANDSMRAGLAALRYYRSGQWRRR